jgi:uncharacterized protein YndB with AHSA1/START domain
MVAATCFATTLEKRRPFAVDGLVPEPIFASTHAITIDAPPERVWPWIAQMGAGRAGWYSWDAIDNGGTPSASRVVPELQTVVPGDVMPAVPRATKAFVVASVDPPRDLVLTVPDGCGGNAVAWEHVLDPIPGGRTRLIVRGLASAQWLDLARAQPTAGHHRIFIERAYAALAMLPRPLLITFATAGHRIMEARHLREIQRRSTPSAEAGASVDRWRRALLSCGILASVLYVAMTLFVGLLWQGYSVASNVPSELSAIGAPTRTLWILLGTVFLLIVVLAIALLRAPRGAAPSVRATSQEKTRALPGDELIEQPVGSLHHAITLRRPRHEVWPWLAQMGAGSRAGWYSYDVLDNGRRPSATGIIPELQQLTVGMLFPAGPGVTDGFTLLAFEPERFLVLGWRAPGDGHVMTWAFVLEEIEHGSTRLLVRVRVRAGARVLGLPWWAAKYLVSAIHFPMQRKQLIGIARRVEHSGNIETRGPEERQDAA